MTIAERFLLGAFACLGAWIALSTIWSVAPAETVLELQRVLVYVAVIAAALLLAIFLPLYKSEERHFAKVI